MSQDTGSTAAPQQDADPAAPDLSVIVPCWNSAATIERAVRSVLDERGVSLECIVVDDASDDATATIVEAIAALDPRVVSIRLESNAGVSAARNAALAAARGTWITFVDADDRVAPGGIAALMRPTRDTDALAVIGQRISTDGERTWMPDSYDNPDIRHPGRRSLVDNLGLLYYAGPPGKAFHRSCTNDLWFEGRSLGDQPWILRALLRAGDRIEVIGDLVYEWWRPHPSEDRGTITTARHRSAQLAANAVRMAGTAFALVTAEVDRLVADAAKRDAFAVAYVDRLLRSDLQPQLSGALQRHDPSLAALLTALGEFFASVPPHTIARSTTVIDRFVKPTLRAWPVLPRDARRAYWSMVRPVARANPALAQSLRGPAGHGWALRWVRSVGGVPGWLGADALMAASRLFHRLVHGFQQVRRAVRGRS